MLKAKFPSEQRTCIQNKKQYFCPFYCFHTAGEFKNAMFIWIACLVFVDLCFFTSKSPAFKHNKFIINEVKMCKTAEDCRGMAEYNWK